MESLIRLLDWLATPLTWLGIIDWNHPSQQLIVTLIYAGVGAYILSNIVSGAKAVTAPVSFAVLFACSLAANRYLHGFRLAGTNELQHVMIYSMLGVVVGSLLIMITLRSATRGEK